MTTHALRSLLGLLASSLKWLVRPLGKGSKVRKHGTSGVGFLIPSYIHFRHWLFYTSFTLIIGFFVQSSFVPSSLYTNTLFNTLLIGFFVPSSLVPSSLVPRPLVPRPLVPRPVVRRPVVRHPVIPRPSSLVPSSLRPSSLVLLCNGSRRKARKTASHMFAKCYWCAWSCSV